MKLRKILVPVICLGAMVLSGCSSNGPSDSGPSASDIEKSLKSVIASGNDAPADIENAKRVLGTMKVKKLGCKPANATDYDCDVEVQAESLGPGGKWEKNIKTASVPMSKGSVGWTIKGSKEWCEMLMNKPTSQLTSNDLEHYQECLAYKKGK
jgi:hypothetical protein